MFVGRTCVARTNERISKQASEERESHLKHGEEEEKGEKSILTHFSRRDLGGILLFAINNLFASTVHM